MPHPSVPPAHSVRDLRAIASLGAEGFKSIRAAREISIAPLTLLAGANSSGKSSMIQPLLLLKQTLEAPYDPGPLLLNGPNARFTQVDQLLNKDRRDCGEFAFRIELERSPRIQSLKLNFCRMQSGDPIKLESVIETSENKEHEIKPGTWSIDDDRLQQALVKIGFLTGPPRKEVVRNRCFFETWIGTDTHPRIVPFDDGMSEFERAVLHVIHVPGLRGNPRRNYPVAATGACFPGTFEDYAASVIASAQNRNDGGAFLTDVGNDLHELGLTWKIAARKIDDTQVELQVGRLTNPLRGGAYDLVSVADVGFGVSQCLPVVVALRTALPGQLVYIEQPEIHLHPRAQHALAKLLMRAALRGVRVVAEIHSSILLLGLQALVAEGRIDKDLVALHWFSRNADGETEIASSGLDEAGRFPEWPVDFDEVLLGAQTEYLDASERRLAP
mgnify:CR=1 FL=1